MDIETGSSFNKYSILMYFNLRVSSIMVIAKKKLYYGGCCYMIGKIMNLTGEYVGVGSTEFFS